ncbi:MAG: transcription antitermination factor NusB [Myxococcota bacterium]
MRRRSREAALQILYQLDMTEKLVVQALDPSELNEVIQAFWQSFDDAAPVDREFAERLVHGVARDLAALDEAITRQSKHWRLERMDKVDRNLLRLAAYEILRCVDIPRAVSINEAIEIARRFSGSSSVAFINGILDHIENSETPQG